MVDAFCLIQTVSSNQSWSSTMSSIKSVQRETIICKHRGIHCILPISRGRPSTNPINNKTEQKHVAVSTPKQSCNFPISPKRCKTAIFRLDKHKNNLVFSAWRDWEPTVKTQLLYHASIVIHSGI